MKSRVLLGLGLALCLFCLDAEARPRRGARGVGGRSRGVSALNNRILAANTGPLFTAEELAKKIAVISMGQSYILGTGSAAIVTASSNSEVKGYRTSGNAVCVLVEGNAGGACTPLMNHPSGIADDETGFVGMGNTWWEYTGGPTDTLLFEAAGLDGTDWDDLGSEMTRIIGDNGYIEDVATLFPGDLHVAIMVIKHGAADEADGISIATYEGYMVDFYDDVEEAITLYNPTQRRGAMAMLIMQFTDQTVSGGGNKSRSNVGIAQFNAATNYPTRNIYVVAPISQYEHQTGTMIHNSGAGQLRMMEQFGRWARGVTTYPSWPRTFSPATAAFAAAPNQNCIDLDYTGHIPCVADDTCDTSPLQFNTTLVDCPDTGGQMSPLIGGGCLYGVEVYDPNPFGRTIAAVPTLINSGRGIRICLSGSGYSGTTVAVGRTGHPGANPGTGKTAETDFGSARHNIFDTTTSLGSDSGAALAAPAAMFEMAVTGGGTPPSNVEGIFDQEWDECWSGASCPVSGSGAFVGTVQGTSVARSSGTHLCAQSTGTLNTASTGIGTLGGDALDPTDGDASLWFGTERNVATITAATSGSGLIHTYTVLSHSFSVGEPVTVSLVDADELITTPSLITATTPTSIQVTTTAATSDGTAIDGVGTITLARLARFTNQDIWIRIFAKPRRPASGSSGLFSLRNAAACRDDIALTSAGNLSWTIQTSGCTSTGANIAPTINAAVPASAEWMLIDAYYSGQQGGEGVALGWLCANGTCTNASGASAGGGNSPTGTVWIWNNTGFNAQEGELLKICIAIGEKARGAINWGTDATHTTGGSPELTHDTDWAAVCASPPCT